MNPIDQLKSVLCDHEGKCCISGSDEDRSIIDRALRALAEPAVEPETVSVFGVKPNGEVVDTGVKAQMPPRMKAKDLVNEMYGRTWEQDDGSESDLCFAVCEEFFEWLIAQGWKASPPPPAEPAAEPFGYFRAEPFGWTDCAPTDEGAKALYEVPPPAEPAPVPLLSDEEIHDIYDEVARSEPYSGAVTRRNVARAIEQLVRRKAGL